jgi:hypothetical protein
MQKTCFSYIFFSANLYLFSAGFELFCRIFSRLATVVPPRNPPVGCIVIMPHDS